jgi:hypothetical protein
VRAEFYREGVTDQVVGTAEWDGGSVLIEAVDEPVRSAIANVFRPTPVVIRDKRESLVHPGTVEWFRAAAGERSEEAGLRVRLVAEARSGWDPAGTYRPLRAWGERTEGGPAPSPAHEPGYF